MKKFSLIALLFLAARIDGFSQTKIELVANVDTVQKSITVEKKIKQTLKKGDNYILSVSSLNNAIYNLKVTAKSFEIASSIPEVLKPVLPGITTSISGGMMAVPDSGDLNIDYLRERVNSSRSRLENLKSIADKLYKLTQIHSKVATATSSLAEVIKEYRNIPVDANSTNIEAFVKQDVAYVATVKAMFDELLKKDIVFSDHKFASLITEITTTNELIKAANYPRYIEFIINSTKANDIVKSKSFYAEKDLMDLKISIIDKYKGDTINTISRTVYIKKFGGLGLSFSSGFFYTEGLSDRAYYLRARQDENLALLQDRRMFFDVSIGALGHVYTNLGDALKTGPAIGISVSPFDGKSRYLLGWSFLIGREKLFSFNAGQAWAKQKQLSTAVREDAQGLYFPKGTSAVPTFDKVVSSWFIGITYNLATTRK